MPGRSDWSTSGQRDKQLDDHVARYTAQLLAGAPGAQAAAKALISVVDGRSPQEVRDFTSRLIAERRASAEGQEGMTAFLAEA